MTMAGVPIDDENGLVLRKCEKYINITNEENNQIECKFKMNDNMHDTYTNSINNIPWKIVPDCGILEPLKTSRIAIYFSPMSDELFHDTVDVLLSSKDEQSNTNDVYLSIDSEEQASFPKLSFDRILIVTNSAIKL